MKQLFHFISSHQFVPKYVKRLGLLILFVVVFLWPSTSFTGPVNNNGLYFDGINDVITVTRQAAISTGITYEAWIKTTSTDSVTVYNGNAALTIIGDNDNNVGTTFGITGGKLDYHHLKTDFTTFQRLVSTRKINDGIWHYVAITHSTAGAVTMYIDGAVEATATFPYFTSYVSYNAIGGSYGTGGSTYGDFFEGALDEVRIWSVVRTQAQIQANMKTEITSTTGMKGLYHFNQGTADGNNAGLTTLTDASTAALNGTLANFALTGTTSNWVLGFTLRNGSALNFSGGTGVHPTTSDYVNIPDNGSMDLGATYTIEAWIYPTDTDNNTIIDKGNYQYLFETHPNGQTGLGLENNTMGWKYSSGTVPTNTWSHVAVTFDANANQVIFYLNGNVLSTHTGAVVNPPDNGAVTIGMQSILGCACNNFDGSMDELRVWNRVLSQCEIQNNMNCEIATTGTGLVANYHFNQGDAGVANTVTTLTDASGNNNNGTLTNFALAGSTSNWITPGGVTTGTTCPAYTPPEINVQGNALSINDGNSVTSSTNGTDFGNNLTTGSTTHTFTVQNTGTGNLDVTGITMTGTDASMFSVSSLTPSSPIASNGSATFTVTFSPTSAGSKTAKVNVQNSDCDETTYDFSVSGFGVLPSYSLTTNATNGTISRLPDMQMYDQGTQVQLTPVPSNGYYFTGWSGDATGNDNPLTITMTAATTITANFAQLTYTLNVSAEHGSVTKQPDMQLYTWGTEVTLQATPAEGYHFDSWSGDAEGNQNPLMVQLYANKNITAIFAINQYAINVFAENGSVTRQPNQELYNHGDSVLLTAIPNEGYHFISWGADVEGTQNPLPVLMLSNKNVVANFEINQYTITASAGPNGSITPNGNVFVTYGGNQMFTITPNTYYAIDSVVIDGEYAGTDSIVNFNFVSVNHTVRVIFKLNGFLLTINSENGTVTRNPALDVYGNGAEVQLTGNPALHYHFLNWSGDVTGTQNPVMVMMNSNKTITAHFAINQYTIAASAGEHGSISPSGNVMVNYGGSQMFTFTPANQYIVDSIRVDGEYEGHTSTFNFQNVTESHQIFVKFKLNNFTITSSAGANGTISPNGSTPVNAGQSQLFTITPNTGYHIDSVIVDGQLAGTNSTYTFSGVTANHTIKALFAINTFIITAEALGSGTIDPSGATTVAYGHNQTFTMTPLNGYHIDSIFVDGVSAGTSSTYQFTSVTASHTIYVSFAPNLYTIVSTSGTNGTISPSGDILVQFGLNQKVTITPNTGYHISGVMLDGETPLGAISEYTFTDVKANHTITASFAINTYTLDVSVNGNGSVTKSPDQQVYNHGTTVTLTAVPDPHWGFSVWNDGKAGLNTNPFDVLMDTAKNMTATFVHLYPVYSSATTAIDYDSVVLGETKDDSVVITNTGNDTLFITSVTSDNSNFTVTPTSGMVLPSASMAVTVEFNALVARENTGNLTITHNADSSPDSVSLSGFGLDLTKFRTLTVSTLLSGKTIKLKKTKNGKMPLPAIANIRDTIFKKTSGITLGKIVGKDSLKYYATIQWKKGADFGKFFTSPHVDPSYPLDSIRSGKKPKKMQKVNKADRKTYNNPLVAELAVLRLNLLGSYWLQLPGGFYNLQYNSPGSLFNGMMIQSIADSLDYALTYYKYDSLLTDTSRAREVKELLHSINGAFADSIDDSLQDVATISPLSLNGVISVSEVPFLIRITGKGVGAWNGNMMSHQVPQCVALEQNYPNPFNPATTIRFTLQSTSAITLTVYDVLGRNIATLLHNQSMEEGEQEVQFDASRLASGVYFYRLTATTDEGTVTSLMKKMMLLK